MVLALTIFSSIRACALGFAGSFLFWAFDRFYPFGATHVAVWVCGWLTLAVSGLCVGAWCWSVGVLWLVMVFVGLVSVLFW